jgi:hypothetical protein
MARSRERPPLRSSVSRACMSDWQKAGRKAGRQYFRAFTESGLYEHLSDVPCKGALEQTDWIRGFLETADGATR